MMQSQAYSRHSYSNWNREEISEPHVSLASIGVCDDQCVMMRFVRVRDQCMESESILLHPIQGMQTSRSNFHEGVT